jgi:hypothetical protein
VNRKGSQSLRRSDPLGVRELQEVKGVTRLTPKLGAQFCELCARFGVTAVLDDGGGDNKMV